MLMRMAARRPPVTYAHGRSGTPCHLSVILFFSALLLAPHQGSSSLILASSSLASSIILLCLSFPPSVSLAHSKCFPCSS